MKKGIITEIDWGYIGATLANSGDEEQIKFFKAFTNEFYQFGSIHQINTQALGISEGLNDKQKYILETIAFKEGSL